MTFKNFLRVAALASIGFSGIAQASLPNNELYIGFRVLNASGTDKDLVLNLGSVSSVGSASGIITNINADLVAAFGANWNTRTDLVWGVAGRDNTSNSFNLYAGNQVGAYSTASNGAYSLAQLNALANTTIGSTNYGTTTGINPNVYVQQFDATTTSWTTQITKGTNTAFSDTKGYLTYSVFEDNADFSVIGSPKDFSIWNFAQGASDFVQIGNGFTFDNAGNFSAVPEPSTYGLMGAGALAAAAFVRRRRKATAKVA